MMYYCRFFQYFIWSSKFPEFTVTSSNVVWNISQKQKRCSIYNNINPHIKKAAFLATLSPD